MTVIETPFGKLTIGEDYERFFTITGEWRMSGIDLAEYHGCVECYAYSLVFGGCNVFGTQIKTEEQFECYKSAFVVHFNERHKGLCEKKYKSRNNKSKTFKKIEQKGTISSLREAGMFGNQSIRIPNDVVVDTIRHEINHIIQQHLAEPERVADLIKAQELLAKLDTCTKCGNGAVPNYPLEGQNLCRFCYTRALCPT